MAAFAHALTFFCTRDLALSERFYGGTLGLAVAIPARFRVFALALDWPLIRRQGGGSARSALVLGQPPFPVSSIPWLTLDRRAGRQGFPVGASRP
mgnify:CR=1 FL=1